MSGLGSRGTGNLRYESAEPHVSMPTPGAASVGPVATPTRCLRQSVRQVTSAYLYIDEGASHPLPKQSPTTHRVCSIQQGEKGESCTDAHVCQILDGAMSNPLANQPWPYCSSLLLDSPSFERPRPLMVDGCTSTLKMFSAAKVVCTRHGAPVCVHAVQGPHWRQ
jgi:hypothetical protein